MKSLCWQRLAEKKKLLPSAALFRKFLFRITILTNSHGEERKKSRRLIKIVKQRDVIQKKADYATFSGRGTESQIKNL